MYTSFFEIQAGNVLPVSNERKYAQTIDYEEKKSKSGPRMGIFELKVSKMTRFFGFKTDQIS